jgi:hypothetical protein
MAHRIANSLCPLTTFQHKHQHKPNFSINEQGVTSGISFTHAQYTDNMVITFAHSSRCSSSFLDNIHEEKGLHAVPHQT